MQQVTSSVSKPRPSLPEIFSPAWPLAGHARPLAGHACLHASYQHAGFQALLQSACLITEQHLKGWCHDTGWAFGGMYG